jgi:hypothetical protein
VEKAKNLGQVVKNEQLKRAKFDRLATGAVAALRHPGERGKYKTASVRSPRWGRLALPLAYFKNRPKAGT